MEHQNKKTEILIKAVFSSKDSYRGFHDLYEHIRDAFVADYIETPQLDELVTKLYWIARGELVDLHNPDDEYGTDCYLGKNMDYVDCGYGLLKSLYYCGFEVVPIFYDGELNSVVLKEVESVRRVYTDDFDDELPF